MMARQISAMDFYISKQEYFDHATTMQKSGRNDVVEWFEKFNCPIKNRTVKKNNKNRKNTIDF